MNKQIYIINSEREREKIQNLSTDYQSGESQIMIYFPIVFINPKFYDKNKIKNIKSNLSFKRVLHVIQNFGKKHKSVIASSWLMNMHWPLHI